MDTNKPSIQAFAVALRKLVESAKADNGKSYDDLAARIRAREADALIEEAIGYVPEELKALPKGDSFRPVQHNGRGGKQSSRIRDLPAVQVDTMLFREKDEL